MLLQVQFTNFLFKTDEKLVVYDVYVRTVLPDFTEVRFLFLDKQPVFVEQVHAVFLVNVEYVVIGQYGTTLVVGGDELKRGQLVETRGIIVFQDIHAGRLVHDAYVIGRVCELIGRYDFQVKRNNVDAFESWHAYIHGVLIMIQTYPGLIRVVNVVLMRSSLI